MIGSLGSVTIGVELIYPRFEVVVSEMVVRHESCISILRCAAWLGFCASIGIPNSIYGQGFVANQRLMLGTESNKSASVRLGDLDGDGDLDAVVANGRHWPQQNFLLFNQGRSRFNQIRPLGIDRLTTYACELADLDGDGDLDIVTGNDMAPCHVFLNDGHANFQRSGSFGGIRSVRSLTVADIDGDSDIDVLMTCRGQPNQVFLNNGDGKFEDGPTFGSRTDSTIDVAVGDVNNDGHMDLVLANRDGQANCWLLNNGQLDFSREVSFGSPRSQTRGVVVGDFNNDGRLDWATANIAQANKVFLGDGKGGVINAIAFGDVSHRTYCIATGDFNSDGSLDIVVGNAGQPNQIYLNKEQAKSFKTLKVGSPRGITYGICVGDLDGDQIADVAVANSDSPNFLYLNRLGRERILQTTLSQSKKGDATKSSLSAGKAAQSVRSENVNVRRVTTDWPSFRGHGARGVADGSPLPLEWNADPEKGELKNLSWQIEVPGLGHSSPVIVGDRLFLLTAVAKKGKAPLQVQAGGRPTAADDNGEQDWLLLCFDKKTGKVLWRNVIHRGKPKATRHAKATHANTSVCVYQDNVVVFLGSEGLYCYDLEGKLRWKRDLGIVNISKYGVGWGYSSSPAVHEDKIVMVCDDPSNPYAIAVRLGDGSEVWKTTRKGDCERSWGSPLIHESDGVTHVVVNGWPWIVSYDFETGQELWRIKGGGDNPVPTPFESNGWFYITNAHGGPSPIYVVRPGARGDISKQAVSASATDSKQPFVWTVDKGGSYMSTPVVYNDRLYVATTRGVVRCFESKTGKRLFEGRLGRKAGVTASLVAGDDKIYVAAENGKVYVLADNPELKILAKNSMGEPLLASPAISDGKIFFRTTSRLIAVEK